MESTPSVIGPSFLFVWKLVHAGTLTIRGMKCVSPSTSKEAKTEHFANGSTTLLAVAAILYGWIESAKSGATLNCCGNFCGNSVQQHVALIPPTHLWATFLLRSSSFKSTMSYSQNSWWVNQVVYSATTVSSYWPTNIGTIRPYSLPCGQDGGKITTTP